MKIRKSKKRNSKHIKIVPLSSRSDVKFDFTLRSQLHPLAVHKENFQKMKGNFNLSCRDNLMQKTIIDKTKMQLKGNLNHLDSNIDAFNLKPIKYESM